MDLYILFSFTSTSFPSIRLFRFVLSLTRFSEIFSTYVSILAAVHIYLVRDDNGKTAGKRDLKRNVANTALMNVDGNENRMGIAK